MEACDRKILIVDDDPPSADMIASILIEQGYTSITVEYGIRKFSDILKDYDLAILDIIMEPFYDGFQIKEYLRQYSPQTRIILISGRDDYDLDLPKKTIGVEECVTKKEIVKNKFNLIMLVKKILEQPSQNDPLACRYDLLNNIVIDNRIESRNKLEVTEILHRLKTSIANDRQLDSNDFSTCVDALVVALSKRTKDVCTIAQAFDAIQIQDKYAPDKDRLKLVNDLEKILIKLDYLPKSRFENLKRVFIVHGHDKDVKLIVARFIEEIGLKPVILAEQPNKGRTIIEKFEQSTDVCYAVVLLTPDDCSYLKDNIEQQISRARQNVILELGYFIGRLGREKVCALYKEGVEIPSDVHGILYIPYDSTSEWKWRLAKEMKAAGMELNL